MKLGVFDSGIGGEAIANSLLSAFPAAEILTVNDRAHMPYGSRTTDEIISLTDTAIQPLIEEDCDIIVIACNTATTVALPSLRQRYPEQCFVGIEPMVKPAAAQTTSGIVAVCATPRTLKSNRYTELKKTHAQHIAVLEPDCSEWAQMIEDGAVNRKQIRSQIKSLLNQHADVIVLGCTHYYWIKDLIEEITRGKATILEPSGAIAARVRQLLNYKDSTAATN